MSGGLKAKLEFGVEAQLELGVDYLSGVGYFADWKKIHLAEVLGWVYST
jgi:hypothetical protein